jgi:hypothetical protein
MADEEGEQADAELTTGADHEWSQAILRDPHFLDRAQDLAAAELEGTTEVPLSEHVEAALTYLAGFKAVLDAGAFPDRLFIALQEGIGGEKHGELLRHGNDVGLSILSLNIGKLIEDLRRRFPPKGD